MTIAKDFEKQFLALPYDKRGFLIDCPKRDEWEENMWHAALYQEEECPSSCDSTVRIEFEDGSVAYFENPLGFVYPQDFHEERV